MSQSCNSQQHSMSDAAECRLVKKARPAEVLAFFASVLAITHMLSVTCHMSHVWYAVSAKNLMTA